MTFQFKTATKKDLRKRRHARVRSRIKGTGIRPRLAVARSNKHISAQLIDDERGVTVASASDVGFAGEGAMLARASRVGAMIAEEAKKLGVDSVVFDRAGYRYTGKIEALANGAREGGLKF